MRSSRSLLPWIVWGVAVAAYSVAIVNRSSLTALGPAAQLHFHIDATVLSLFPVIQLIVYAGLQIPVGVLLDRIGSSGMILIGGVLMVGGQALMATAGDVSLAILARVLVGAGDACTFISVMRMLPEWFSLRQLPTISQVTMLLGQAGQLMSVTPLVALVAAVGWMNGFLGVAAATLLISIIGFFVLRDAPGSGTVLERLIGRTGRMSSRAQAIGGDSTSQIAAMAPPATEMIMMQRTGEQRGPGFTARLRGLLKLPGVRLAYWMHFTSPFTVHVFLLLWGVPFLTGGIGLSQSAANGLVSLAILSGMFGSLVLGPISSRFAERRVWIFFGITLTLVVVWLAVLLWPGIPPLGLIVLLMIVMPFGGPASMISFEVARSHTPRSFAGFSTGLVNTGGFTAALIVILLVGLVLDLQGAGSPESYSMDAFRWAFLVQVPFWALGLTMILIERRRTQRWMETHGRTLR